MPNNDQPDTPQPQHGPDGKFQPGNTVGKQFQPGNTFRPPTEKGALLGGIAVAKAKGLPLYSDEFADKFLEIAIEKGTWKWACAEPGMPHPTTVRKWRTQHPSFDARCNEAEPFMGDSLAQAALDITEEATACARTGEKHARDMIQAARVEADVKLRVAQSKNSKYGTRHEHTVTANVKHLVLDWKSMSPGAGAMVEAIEKQSASMTGAPPPPLPPADGAS